eukprot:s2196_g12.t4
MDSGRCTKQSWQLASTEIGCLNAVLVVELLEAGCANASRLWSLGAGKGTPCRFGNQCTRPDCWYIHLPPPPPPRPPRLQVSVRLSGPDRNGANVGAVGASTSAARTARPEGSAATTPLENVVDVFEVAADIHNQLRHGMLYHFNRYLRPHRMQGRLQSGSYQVELLSAGTVALPPDFLEQIQVELLRLASLRQELTDRIPMPQHFVRRLIGPQGKICRMLSRDLGVQIYVHNSPDESERDAFVEFVGVPALIEEARAALEQHLISFLQRPPHHAVPELQLAAEMQEVVHVFVDNSNISIGCQFLPSGTRDFTQRLCIQKFAQAVIGARQVRRQVVVGSKPPRGHAIWQHWENAGYQVLVEWRDPDTNREQFVDARLVAEALMHVGHVDRQDGPRGRGHHVLALCTGDGNLEGQAPGSAGANFINLVKDVAQRGWKVEVWCWHSTCNSAYRRLAEDPDLQVKLCFLDGLRSKITMTSRPLDEESLCVQCIANIPTHAFQPCNHKILCEACAADVAPHRGRPPLGWCFICREEWDAIALVSLQLLGQLYSLRCFVVLCCGDPGYCRVFTPGQMQTGCNSTAGTSNVPERLAGFPREYIEVATSEAVELDPGGWRKEACVICGRLRAARCKHCRHCGRCVARFDHHCPWLGNCIGARNLSMFLRFLMSTLLSLLLALKLIWEISEECFSSWLVSALLLLDCILVLFVVCVFLQHVLLAAADLTGYEDSKTDKDAEHLCQKLRRLRFRVLLSNFAGALSLQMQADLQADLEAYLPGDPEESFVEEVHSPLRHAVVWMKGQRGTAAYGTGRGVAPLIPPAAGFKGVTPVPTASQKWQQQQQQQSWQQDQWQKEDRGPPRVLNLELTQESQLTTQGFPPEAPAIEHDKSMTVFSSAHSVLSEVVGDISSEVEIHHDTEWDIFPEIGEAIQRAGGEELCFSVVTCPNHGKWAVGIAAGKKGREVAGKLALAFALLVDRDPADLENFCKNYAEFRAVLADAGLLPPRGGPQKRHMHFPPAGGKAAPPFAAAPSPAPFAAPAADLSGGFPQYLWISLDDSASLVQEGMPSEGFCVYYDKQCAELFRSGQSVLQERDEDVLVRCNSWAGESSVANCKPNHSRTPKGDDCHTQSDAKCYGGRFTYGQWRQFFARQPEKGLRLDASGQVIQEGNLRDFSWNSFVQFFRAEIWLLVLLHSDGASMASMACLCQGYQKISLPWQHRGSRSGFRGSSLSNGFTVSKDSKVLEKPMKPEPLEPKEKHQIQEVQETTSDKTSEKTSEKTEQTGVMMGVSQLAARLRCGLHLAEELLDSNEISLPRQCGSWLDLLCKQEMQGAWLCVVCIGRNAEVVENFCEAVARAEQENTKVATVALLPSAQQHVTAGEHVRIRKAMKIIGLPLPHLGGADFQLRSRWHTPANPPWSYNQRSGWRTYVPTLGLQSLEIKLKQPACGSCDDYVELQNFILCGIGTQHSRPTGISDCVLRVAAGTCLLADCQVRLKEGNAGFGVVVGPDILAPFGGSSKPHVMLKRSEVVHASTSCLCFMGGQLTIEEGCSLRDCHTGISVCDQGSIAFILANIRMSCRDGGQKVQQVSGGIVTEMMTDRQTDMNPHMVSNTAVGDVNNEVVITHDPDWDQMPEIAEAIKQAGGEETCYAVGTLPSHGLWAVGLAGGWKFRESACKLALSIALVATTGEIDRFASSQLPLSRSCAEICELRLDSALKPGLTESLREAPKRAKATIVGVWPDAVD